MPLQTSDLLQNLERWAASYSPFNPLETNDIELEMQRLAGLCVESDIEILLENIPDAQNDDLHYAFMRFSESFCDHHKSPFVIDRIFERLHQNGPEEIIELIGYTRLPHVLDKLLNKLNYFELSQEGKFSLINTLLLMKNKDCASRINQFIEMERDEGVLHDLNILKNSIESW